MDPVVGADVHDRALATLPRLSLADEFAAVFADRAFRRPDYGAARRRHALPSARGSPRIR